MEQRPTCSSAVTLTFQSRPEQCALVNLFYGRRGVVLLFQGLFARGAVQFLRVFSAETARAGAGARVL